MNQHSQIRVGTMPSQFHHQADGIGHLIQFPVSELLKHAARLTKILEAKGVTQEVTHREGDWGKTFLSGPINYHIVDELLDVNRAIAIADILGEGEFIGFRNTYLSKGLSFGISDGEKETNSINLDLFAPVVENNYSSVPPEMIKRALDIMQLLADDIGWIWYEKAVDEIDNYEENGGEKVPSIYKWAVLDFISKFTDYLDAQGTLEERKINLRKIIDDISRNLHDMGDNESFEKFVKYLRTAYPEETVDAYRDFTFPTNHEDMYPEISWEDLLMKNVKRIREVVDAGAETPNQPIGLNFVTGDYERIDF